MTAIPLVGTPPGARHCNFSAAPGAGIVTVPGLRGDEFILTVTPLPGEAVAAIVQRLAQSVTDLGAAMVHLRVLGNIAARAATLASLRRCLGELDWPIAWLEGAPCDGGRIGGFQAIAFSGAVRRLRLGDNVVGSVYDDGAFRHCLIDGVGPILRTASRSDQTRQALDQLGLVLDQAGFSFADVIRTWFFLDELLDWYGDFNAVRTQFYSGISFRTGSLPASTGIGARNPAGHALMAGAWATHSLLPETKVEEIASPLQCPAPKYGSSFSRAMELTSPAGRRLVVSGTASIAPGGATLWPEDARRQVAQTMEVIEAILQSRGFQFSDTSRAIAYFKHPTDALCFTDWCAARGLSLPVVLAHCDVCRDDLLFELELDAVADQTAL